VPDINRAIAAPEDGCNRRSVFNSISTGHGTPQGGGQSWSAVIAIGGYAKNPIFVI
jgi:hypothetical protein